MNVEIGTEVTQFLFWEHINVIFIAQHYKLGLSNLIKTVFRSILVFPFYLCSMLSINYTDIAPLSPLPHLNIKVQIIPP
jgi:hypothetical protein